MARRRKKMPETPEAAVDWILADERVVWFPVKHYSPVCAWHLREVIRQLEPVGVLVEGPDDATELVPHIVADDTRPPLTVLSTYVDKRNQFGLNGTLSPSEDVPARYRGWWPLVEYSPEYQALKAGAEVGAELEFIDTSLRATIPHQHVRKEEAVQAIDDHNLATSGYFQLLAKRQRRRSFEEFWQANFEVDGFRLDPISFMRRVLTFAWCARNVGGASEEALEADGTILRERHMRWCVERFLRQHDSGRVVVVTGAFHSVALPWTKKKRARKKADRYTETVLTSHSYRALSTLYTQNRRPQHGDLAWRFMSSGSDSPFDDAAMQLLVQVQRTARHQGTGISTADTVGAYRVARNLATLRGNRQITVQDLVDAVEMAYIKGDASVGGPEIHHATEEVLVGDTLGRVTPEAGQVPIMRDFYAQAKSNRIDVTGKSKVVRCDIHKRESHRLKSAFLHQCDLLEIPLFSTIDTKSRYRRSSRYYKGPNLVTGEDLHLIGETWGIQWNEEVDDRLLQLSDRGASIAQGAESVLRDQLASARGNAADTTKLLLRCAQTMLLSLFDEVLEAVEDAVEADSAFENLVSALSDFVVLHSYRDSLATQGHERLLKTIVGLYKKACLVLPAIGNADPADASELLDRFQTLVRIALTFEAAELDRELLIDKVREMVDDLDANAAIRGSGYGVLFSVGATRERVVARELEGYLLGSPDRVLQAGAFLDGLFMTSKSIFMGSTRLLQAINRVLAQLDWTTFKLILPDLRRAFTQFIPAELDRIGEQVSEQIGLDRAPDPDEPVPLALARYGHRADQRVSAILDDWWAEPAAEGS